MVAAGGEEAIVTCQRLVVLPRASGCVYTFSQHFSASMVARSTFASSQASNWVVVNDRRVLVQQVPWRGKQIAGIHRYVDNNDRLGL